MEQAGGRASKDDWFRKRGYTNTITLPASVENKLVEKVQAQLEIDEAGSKSKTLVMADGGTQIGSQFIKSDPFPLEQCSRPDCYMCKSEAE